MSVRLLGGGWEDSRWSLKGAYLNMYKHVFIIHLVGSDERKRSQILFLSYIDFSFQLCMYAIIVDTSYFFS